MENLSGRVNGGCDEKNMQNLEDLEHAMGNGGARNVSTHATNKRSHQDSIPAGYKCRNNSLGHPRLPPPPPPKRNSMKAINYALVSSCQNTLGQEMGPIQEQQSPTLGKVLLIHTKCTSYFTKF